MSNKFVKIKNKNKKPSTKKQRRTGLIIFIVIYVIALSAIIIFAARKGYTDKSVDSFVYDDFEVFTEEQERDMNDNCKSVQQKYGVNVYISTCERKSYYTYGYYDDDYYATQDGDDFRFEHNFGYNDNLIIIILNCQKYNETERYNYHFDIYTFGTAAKKISDSEIDKIIWSSAGDDILSSDSEQAKNGIIQMTMDLGVAYAWILNYNWIPIIAATIAIGVVIAFIVNAGIKKSYSKKRDNQSFSFSANTNLNLTVREDIFSHKNVTYVRIERSSSSSFGGGHSSGGGGGGGHRGGR